ncbi:MAG: aldose 1-epimerase family protein [Alteraurantiacibacter sp.]
MSQPVTIGSECLTARIDPLGAELVSLCDSDGRELLTPADPARWTGHAPLLFPIVGRLNGDVLRLDGREYPMKQHGFARRLVWELVGAGEDAVTFVLRDSEETRAAYPFAFELAVLYALEDATLTVAVRVSNPGPEPLPMSFGWHPAFAWPLPFGQPRADHLIVFEREEGPAITQLSDGLVVAEVPSPLTGRTLALDDALFANDALIWAPVTSQKVTYGASDGPHLRVSFPDTPFLGVWSQPGAGFVCIEPWHGHADPDGFLGDFHDKPGVISVGPGADWRCTMSVTLAG